MNASVNYLNTFLNPSSTNHSSELFERIQFTSNHFLDICNQSNLLNKHFKIENYTLTSLDKIKNIVITVFYLLKMIFLSPFLFIKKTSQFVLRRFCVHETPKKNLSKYSSVHKPIYSQSRNPYEFLSQMVPEEIELKILSYLEPREEPKTLNKTYFPITNRFEFIASNDFAMRPLQETWRIPSFDIVPTKNKVSRGYDYIGIDFQINRNVGVNDYFKTIKIYNPLSNAIDKLCNNFQPMKDRIFFSYEKNYVYSHVFVDLTKIGQMIAQKNQSLMNRDSNTIIARLSKSLVLDYSKEKLSQKRNTIKESLVI